MSEESLSISVSDVTSATRLADALLALNNDHALELSWLTPERLMHLAAQAICARRVGEVDAFLLAFDERAD